VAFVFGAAPASAALAVPGPATGVQSFLSKVPPTPPTNPSVVPQKISHRGEAGYNVFPASQLGLTSSAARSGETFFRGGAHSKAPSGAPSAPRFALTPSSPRINLSGTLNKPGLTAAGTQQSTPPDSTGAIGLNHYVEMANSDIAVYDRSLNLVSSATLDAFIGAAAGVPFCDPQIQWDSAASRWLFAFLYCNLNSSTQRIVFGWSKTSDPHDLSVTLNTSNAWCQFYFQNDPYLLDFPKLGHNDNYLIVGGNLFDESTPNPNPPFVSAGIEWARLPANGDPTCPLSLTVGGNQLPLKNRDGVTYTFTPVPVNTDGPASDGYILSAYDPSGNSFQSAGPRSKVAIWHLDAAGVLHGDNDVMVNSYSEPSSAPQLGTGFVLDTLAGQLTQAVGHQLTGMYTQHTVAGPGGRSEVDWYEFRVASGGAVTLAQQGTISSPTDWDFNAAISPRLDGGGAAIVYNRSSPSIDPVIAAQIRYSATAPGMMNAGELVLASSAAADTEHTCFAPLGPPCRWGDYAGATPDPINTNLVWGTSEFNTASGSTPAWSDQNFAIAPTPEAPTSVHAVARGRSAAGISWTPEDSDPLAPATSYTVTAYPGMAQMTVPAPATSMDFTGLTFGVTYTFTVFATCIVGSSLESSHSNALIIGDSATQSGPTTAPSRDSPNQSGGGTARAR
jgi:hypothetical protein